MGPADITATGTMGPAAGLVSGHASDTSMGHFSIQASIQTGPPETLIIKRIWVLLLATIIHFLWPFCFSIRISPDEFPLHNGTAQNANTNGSPDIG